MFLSIVFFLATVKSKKPQHLCPLEERGGSHLMMETLTFIVHKDPETDMLVTGFEVIQQIQQLIVTTLYVIRSSV